MKNITQQIIDKMYSTIDNASYVPLSPDKIMISKDSLMAMLDELSRVMTIEYDTYRDITDKKGKVLEAARKEAEDIIYEAEKTASRIRVTKRTTPVSPLRQEDLSYDEIKALNNANDIYAASIIHADETLTEVCDIIADAYHSIQSEYEKAMRGLEEKASILEENKKELIGGLEELEVEDRYHQILEISRVLSNELYDEKAKARSGEYIDDMQIQLDIDGMTLDEESSEINEVPTEQSQEDKIFIPRVVDFMSTIKTYSRESGYKLGEELTPVQNTEEVKELTPAYEPEELEIVEDVEAIEVSDKLEELGVSHQVEESEVFEKIEEIENVENEELDIQEKVEIIQTIEEPKETEVVQESKEEINKEESTISVLKEAVITKELQDDEPTRDMEEIIKQIQDIEEKKGTRENVRNMSVDNPFRVVPKKEENIENVTAVKEQAEVVTDNVEGNQQAEVETNEEETEQLDVEIDKVEETEVTTENIEEKPVKKPIVPSVLPANEPKQPTPSSKTDDGYDEIVMRVLENKKKNGGKIVYEQLTF